MEALLNALVLMLNFLILPALTYGSQLALGALGVTVIYAVLNFSNFAHGETMSFGAMAVILVTWFFQSQGIHPGYLPTALLALPFGIVATVVFVLATDRLVYSYHRQRNTPPVILMIASLGVMFLMNGLVRLIIGADDQTFFDGERYLVSARDFKTWTGLSEVLVLKSTQIITLITTLIMVGLLFWFLNKTRTGTSMRAYADNKDLALLSGINPDRVVRFAWLIAASLAVIAGTLYGLDKSYKPLIFLQLLLPVFASAIVGGVGNPVGAVVGGFVIAFSEIGITFAYKKFVSYLVPETLEPDGLVQLLSTDYKYAVSFVILVAVLLIKPKGLFSGKTL